MSSNIRRSAAALAIGGAAAASLAATPAANAAPLEAWEALAQCESGGNWSINTGNGFYGGLQFTQSSWTAAGGAGSPQNASKAEQIRVAENLLQMQGWGAWPACSSKLNLYAYGTGSAPAAVAETPDVAAQANEVAEVVAPVVEAAAPVEAVAPVEIAAPVEAAAPVAEAVAEAAPAGNTYTVAAGDTLSAIAYAHGFNGWDELVAANSDLIKDANIIEIGWALNIPAK